MRYSKVVCNWCGWEGEEEEIQYRKEEEHCPNCQLTGYLMDKIQSEIKH